MLNNTQKNEQYYFKKFCAAKGLTPKDIIPTDKPDIIFNQEGKSIGVEVTNFFLESGREKLSEQRQSNLRANVVKKAQELYEKSRPTSEIEIIFSFNKITSRPDDLALKIKELIISLDQNLIGKIPSLLFQDIPELNLIHINKVSSSDMPWRPLAVFAKEKTNTQKFQEIIDTKSQKAENYQPCDELWLLIVVDFINPAMDQEITNVDYTGITNSKFDKVFLYKTGFDDIIKFV